MITLTGLNGRTFALNADLIVRAQSTPDTVLTLLDGTKFVVREDVDTVVQRIREFRASVLTMSRYIEFDTPGTPVLRLIPGTAGDAVDDEAGDGPAISPAASAEGDD